MTQWGIETLFNPSKRHADEEKRRLQATREVVGDSSGGRKIDLESGTVRISRAKPAAAADSETDADSGGARPDTDHADRAEADPATAESAEDDSVASTDSDSPQEP